jgi:hypothetical protein
MAAAREYAYFIKGSKLAIVEKDTSFDNDVDSRDYGPGTDRVQWKSPLANIADGIELEYTYSPAYQIATSLAEQVNKFWFNGWTVIGGYLTFVRSHSASIPNFNSAPYASIGEDEYILIRGNQWNGLHKVKDAGANGYVQTYTKLKQGVKYVQGGSNIDIAGEADSKIKITANDDSNVWLGSIFDADDFVFIYAASNALNNGFWKVDSVATTSADERGSEMYITDRYWYPDQLSTTVTDLSEEQIDTTPDSTIESNNSAYIYQAFHEPCYAITDVNVLNDETDEIPVPPYMERALVDYVKAQFAEETGNIEMKEYFLKEFRKKVEKHESSKLRGVRSMIAGPHAIR